MLHFGRVLTIVHTVLQCGYYFIDMYLPALSRDLHHSHFRKLVLHVVYAATQTTTKIFLFVQLSVTVELPAIRSTTFAQSTSWSSGPCNDTGQQETRYL